MATDVKTANTLKGAEWLIRESNPSETFIPEEFNEEQKMVIDMCYSFLESEVTPILDRIDNLETGLMPALMDKAGEQGLLSTSIPEEYGGLGNTGK
jgi:alkylation response protein AidB-like acyl-CoA dehydrogenase